MASTKVDQYLGETKKQLRDGFGVYTYSNKFFKYEGEWKDGKKNGHGKLTMADDSYYEGEFKDGEIEGHGFRFWSSSKNTYSGQFVQGELHGQGVMRYADGTIYEGEWHRNKRQGYGSYRDKNGVQYNGYFYEHKRHGEGTAQYPDGDVYNGNWVLDKRQGHGELNKTDGTVYEGQWRNDMYNGQGALRHCSGFIYEGMFINNEPVVRATKIVFSGLETNELEVTQGQSFTVEVEFRNDDNELIEDMGRELKISAGFKHLVAKEAGAIYDSMEDTQEEPIPTPFGYSIVGFPLTDQMPENLESDNQLGVPKSNTNLAESTEDLSEVQDGKEDEEAEVVDEDEQAANRDVESPVEMFDEDVPTPLPPPIHSVRSQYGKATWPTVVIPPPPRDYKPFAILDALTEEINNPKKAPKSKSSSKLSEAGSRPATKLSHKSASSSTVEKLPRTGEYVLMVHDVTNPPWMGETLKPAYLLVKILKRKKAIKTKEKEKERKWDTQKHIAESMARGYTDLAESKHEV